MQTEGTGDANGMDGGNESSVGRSTSCRAHALELACDEFFNWHQTRLFVVNFHVLHAYSLVLLADTPCIIIIITSTAAVVSTFTEVTWWFLVGHLTIF